METGKILFAMRDGGLYVGTITPPELSLGTEYGRLSIPVAELREIVLSTPQGDRVSARRYQGPGQLVERTFELRTEYGVLRLPAERFARGGLAKRGEVL